MSSSVWDKLGRLFGRPALVVPEDLSQPALEAPHERTPRRDAEAWLADLVARLAAGQSAAVREVAGPAVKRNVDILVEAGHPRLAAEWLDKLATATPPGAAADDLRARAVKLYLERGDFADALPHLAILVASPSHAAHAHFHLGEHHQRQGDRERALRHFEAVLAVDVDFPNARARAESLRLARGAAAPAATVTIAGVDGQTATAGARYRLLAELGRGAAGAVYRAHDVELDREVAIKLLHAHLRGTMARFFAEARVAAALRHAHIVAVLDLDEEHGRIVMELATGGTLKERLGHGPLPLLEALEVHAALLSALAAAHRHGVVHRDLKPANLLYRRPGGDIVLGDFGIAHLGAGTTGEALGTLFYMAPEQRRGIVTPAVDVWAAGVILHEMLVGRAPSGLAGPAAVALPARLGADALATAAGLDDLAAPIAEHLAALTSAVPEERPSAAAAAARADALRERARAGDAPRRFAAEIAGRLSG